MKAVVLRLEVPLFNLNERLTKTLFRFRYFFCPEMRDRPDFPLPRYGSFQFATNKQIVYGSHGLLHTFQEAEDSILTCALLLATAKEIVTEG
jgi:hypothetical protein